MTVRPKTLAALALFLAAAGFALVDLPDAEARMARMSAELDAAMQSREKHIDPGEMQSLLNNNQLELFVLDVRDEADFNLFHLLDAYRISMDELDSPWLRGLRPSAVKVLISNDEARAEQAWRGLTARGKKNVYVLAGGINLWLDIFKDGKPGPPHADLDGAGDDRLRHRFPYASGHEHPASDPRPRHGQAQREYPEKVKASGPKKSAGGGCG